MTDHKILELILNNQSAMQADIQAVKSSQDAMQTDIKQLSTKVDKIEASQVRIENELTEKIRGLYDFREVQNDVNNRILSALERIESKLETHEIQIQVLDATKANKRKAK